MAAVENLSPSYPQRAPWGTAEHLRAWQEEALHRYFSLAGPDGPGKGPQDFLTAATPGSGKTTFALRLAADLLRENLIAQIIVVTPTEHLKTQWAVAASRATIRLNPAFSHQYRSVPRPFQGIVVTYAQVSMRPSIYEQLVLDRRTLVILDEVHHGGDAHSWGDALREGFARAHRRLLLTGTPFRSDTSPIPFVRYDTGAGGTLSSHPDYSYGYRRALEDGVVRPVIFMVYAGMMRWRTRMGEEMTAQLGQDNTTDVDAQAWRTALDPAGEWISAVFRSAHRRLTEVRQHIPDAGGLVIASDQDTARAYAQILQTLTGEQPTVVLSDESDSSQRIEDFAADTSCWMVAVRMVSEGVDVPRLCVGVYATNASTPLFFAQAVGRFVRTRRRGETASIFLPNVPALLALAKEIEQERDHVIDRTVPPEWSDEDESDNSEQEGSALPGEDELPKGQYQPIESFAHFDRVLYDGSEFGQLATPGTREEEEFLGIPGIISPEHAHDLLLQRQARQQRHRQARQATQTQAEPEPLHRSLKEQRQLLNNLVGLYAHQSGEPHGVIHTRLRQQCGGPAVRGATVAQLQSRIEMLRRWLKS